MATLETEWVETNHLTPEYELCAPTSVFTCQFCEFKHGSLIQVYNMYHFYILLSAFEKQEVIIRDLKNFCPYETWYSIVCEVLHVMPNSY